MVVFRETQRIYHTDAPTRHTISDQVDHQPDLWANTWDCAQDAAANLLLLLQDAAKAIATAKLLNPAPPGGAVHLDDVRDLVRLGYWLVECPMHKIVQRRHERGSRVGNWPTPSDIKFCQDMVHIHHSLWMIQCLLFDVGISQLPLHDPYKAIQSDIPQWTNPNERTARNISVLGFMELLLRIIAHTSPDLAALRASINNLASHRPHNPGYEARGIPRVVFICAGRNAGRFVITTSKDHWYFFTSLHDMSKDSRSLRQTAPPVVGNGGGAPAFNVPAISDQAFQHLETFEDDVADVSSNEATENIRRNAIRSWQALLPAPRYAAHDGEFCVPLTCPDFTVKARCLRCQAMFRYDVTHPDAAGLEQAERDWRGSRLLTFDRLCNKGWDCAETLAHFYCAAANAANAVNGGRH
ncbi:hypothetical protein QBC44DRAFT_345376 [Cladorrhinum sp. PSN332]|nr:hypothetical protein QBC44DRAFT_345376 [Cladorrhinum sp. PSN332]